MLIRAAAALVVTGVLAACAQRGGDQPAQPSPAPTMNPELRATQRRLVEEDRRARTRRLAEIAAIAQGSARDVTPAGSTVERLVVTVTNRGRREITRVDGGVAIYDGVGRTRLGLSTFSAPAGIAPGRTAHLAVAIPMGAFAEGAGPLARTAGTPKRVELDLTGFGFASGGSAGERD